MSIVPASAEPGPNWDRTIRRTWLVELLGVGLFLGVAFSPLAGPHPVTQAFISYLVAFTFWFAVPMGCLVALMIQYLTGGAWGIILRPILEGAVRTLPLIVVLFVPVAVSFFLGVQSPYAWARPLDTTAAGEALEDMENHAYLMNPPFVTGRAAIYFLVWLLLAYFLIVWSARWRQGDAVAGPRLPSISGPGIILYAIFITFAAIDWTMSLEPYWTSSIFSPVYALGQIIEGFAFATIAAALLSRYPPLRGRVLPKHFRDLGGLLLAWVLLWAYCSFSQFLQVWAGNLPDESPYYLKRTRGGWQWVGLSILVLHFFVPFLLLLQRAIKDHPKRLAAVAAWILLLRWVDVFWWIEPAFPHEHGPGGYWLMDIGATIALGGIWIHWFARIMRHVSLEPVHGEGQCETEGVRCD